MNIVYLLTNLDKKEGETRFYIGSKVECRIEELHKRDVIIDIKTEKIYWGSCSNKIMHNDLKTQRFKAEILEIVPDRTKLLQKENEWILKKDAVNSTEFYNLSAARIGGHMYAQKNISNIFGETVIDIAKSGSTIGKRNNTAKSLGFENLYELCKFIFEEKSQGKKCIEISRKLNKERHFVNVFTKYYDLSKMIQETKCYDEKIYQSLVTLFNENASVLKISEISKLEIPSVIFYLDKYINAPAKYIAALRKGHTPEKLENEILKLVLNGKTIPKASEELKMNITSGYRYFYRVIRKRLNSNDIQ